MPSVWEQRFAEAVKRLTALRESTALEVIPDLWPVLPMLDPAAWEVLFARRERRGIFQFSTAAVVGQLGTHVLENPATSGVLAVIDSVWFGQQGSAQVWRWGTTSEVAASIAANLQAQVGEFTDYRGPRSARSALIPRAAAQVGGYTSGIDFVQVSNDNIERRVGVVLPPGTAWGIQMQTLNAASSIAIVWREREAGTAEAPVS